MGFFHPISVDSSNICTTPKRCWVWQPNLQNPFLFLDLSKKQSHLLENTIGCERVWERGETMEAVESIMGELRTNGKSSWASMQPKHGTFFNRRGPFLILLAKSCGGCHAAVFGGQESIPAHRGSRSSLCRVQNRGQCQALHPLLFCRAKPCRRKGKSVLFLVHVC